MAYLNASCARPAAWLRSRDGFKLYECFIDGTFAKARGGGDGVGLTKAGKGVKIMILVDAQGLPVAIDTMAASPHESKLVQRLFDFMLTSRRPGAASSATRRMTTTGWRLNWTNAAWN
ncbi:MAG: hypothetical protein U1D55_15665 [Phycisphaerae bacterium]